MRVRVIYVSDPYRLYKFCNRVPEIDLIHLLALWLKLDQIEQKLNLLERGKK